MITGALLTSLLFEADTASLQPSTDMPDRVHFTERSLNVPPPCHPVAFPLAQLLHPSFANDILATLTAHPYLMYLSSRHIDSSSCSKRFVLRLLIIWVRDGKLASTYEMGRDFTM